MQCIDRVGVAASSREIYEMVEDDIHNNCHLMFVVQLNDHAGRACQRNIEQAPGALPENA